MSQTTDFGPYEKPRMPRMTMALDTSMPQTLERPASFESDSVNDNDDNDTTLRSDSSIDGTPIQLPQRPDVALTRDVHWFSPRQRTKCMSPSRLMPITNHGLALASVPLHVKEIGPAPPEAAPGAIAVMADDRLDQQARQRRGDPQDGQAVDLGPQRLEDAAGVGVLQAEADLDAEEADAHVPDRQAGQARAVG